MAVQQYRVDDDLRSMAYPWRSGTPHGVYNRSNFLHLRRTRAKLRKSITDAAGCLSGVAAERREEHWQRSTCRRLRA